MPDAFDVLDDIVDALEVSGVIYLGSGGDGYDGQTMSGQTVDVILASGHNATLMLVIHD